MSKLCTYIVRIDVGLAPNPFWGYCTLAVCTPNHQGARIERGDWIAGFLNKARDNQFLYAMEVSEVLDFGDYFLDSRFQRKRPSLRGSGREKCGDNFYSKNTDGSYRWHRNRFHPRELKDQDTRHPRVFISKRFWYLGKSAVVTPKQFMPLVGGRGVRVNHDPRLVKKFQTWVATTFPTGVSDIPYDDPDMMSMDEGCGVACRR